MLSAPPEQVHILMWSSAQLSQDIIWFPNESFNEWHDSNKVCSPLSRLEIKKREKVNMICLHAILVDWIMSDKYSSYSDSIFDYLGHIMLC